MILDIETGLKNPTLRTPSEPIKTITRDIHKLARDMKASIKPNHGMGLAAPQVGHNVRMVLINIPGEYFEETGFADCKLNQHYIILNPVITSVSTNTSLIEEGCLSLPEYFADVVRPSGVVFTGLNLKGETIGGEATGIFARIIQHEIDHLDGILFADKALPSKPKQAGKIYV
ncbi:MAG: peptide deformylase [Minisyncoccia bacterium]